MTTRIVDLIAPIGKGQRCLIVSPPRAGKTMLLQNIANAITTNHPEVKLIVLLIDERPEEVTDMERTVKGEVISSTFDEPATRHVQVAEMVIEKAKRLVEHKRDVVILLDSITRLARAYNTVVPPSRQDPLRRRGLQRPPQAQALLRRGPQHRGGRLPDHHRHRAGRHRQPHGRGHLRGVQGHRQHRRSSSTASSWRSASSRAWTSTSRGTRKEELLLPPDWLSKIYILRQTILNGLDNVEAMKFMLDKFRQVKSHDEFFKMMVAGGGK